MNRQFSDKEIKTIKEHMRKCSKSLIIRLMKIKTTLRYHLTPSVLAHMTAGESDECWRECSKIGTLMHCWWSCELIQSFWMSIWHYAQRVLKDYLPFDLAIPLLGSYPKEIIGKTHVQNIYSRALCGGKKLENEGMPFDWGIAEQIVVSDGYGLLLC